MLLEVVFSAHSGRHRTFYFDTVRVKRHGAVGVGDDGARGFEDFAFKRGSGGSREETLVVAGRFLLLTC